MPHIDLEPGDYRVKGRKEPILLPGWWIGIVVFVAMVLVATFVLRPMHSAWAEWSAPFFYWLLGGKSG